ncbi:hypothetical protein GYMLUDRAFT_50130 [Collybiopsis luxurians FD-317 M1]|uniref:ABM domain-containing protein n=1 Tax=Collybiopsis luxurians FD-317 M1 TaxID=944289 RepID=A0A0D0CB47_9AGAR|nr:hypothetical protein GYMLUDRAFT_50130 [Collybiopsis luxurians FD-317 M1]
MAPILSYITFPASQSFIAEDAQVKSAIEELTNTDGLISSYHGLQVPEEGAKFGYLLSTWESPEKLKAFRDVSGDKFNSLLARLSVGEIERYEFVAIRRVPEPAFESKVVELAIGRCAEGVTLDAHRAITIKMSDTIQAAGWPCAVGESADGIILLAAGWESSTEHWDFSKREGARDVFAEIQKTAPDAKFTHVSLKKSSR